MNWSELVDLTVDDGRLILELGPAVLIALGLSLVGLAYGAVRKRGLFRRWEPIEANLRLGGIGSVTIRPNHDDIQVAHKAWVELATRKAGLPFDRDNDVIVEVYDSWYELFGEMRRLAKEFPAHRLAGNRGTRVVDLIVDALNRGLRPHLTRWQARLRRWYDKASDDHPGEPPQEIQRLFPGYDELVADLERVNTELLQYMRLLRAVASGTGAQPSP